MQRVSYTRGRCSPSCGEPGAEGCEDGFKVSYNHCVQTAWTRAEVTRLDVTNVLSFNALTLGQARCAECSPGGGRGYRVHELVVAGGVGGQRVRRAGHGVKLLHRHEAHRGIHEAHLEWHHTKCWTTVMACRSPAPALQVSPQGRLRRKGLTATQFSSGPNLGSAMDTAARALAHHAEIAPQRSIVFDGVDYRHAVQVVDAGLSDEAAGVRFVKRVQLRHTESWSGACHMVLPRL